MKFNRSVYSDSTIQAAIQAYRNIAMISAKVQGDYVFLTFWKCKYDAEQTRKEFENYMIGIENT